MGVGIEIKKECMKIENVRNIIINVKEELEDKLRKFFKNIIGIFRDKRYLE